MLRKAAVVGLTGLMLGVSPAAANSIGDGSIVALTMIGGGGLMSIGCAAIAILTEDDEDEEGGYDRRGFFAGIGPSYARQNFSDSAVIDRVYGDLQENLRILRGTPIPNVDPGIYPLNLDSLDDDAFGFAGRVGYRCHPYISTELQFEWLDDFEGTINEVGMPTNDSVRKFNLELESLVFTTNVKGHLLTGRTQPFVLLGVGFMRMESKARDASGGTIPGVAGQASDRSVEVALRYGAGLDFYLTEKMVATAEGSYLMPTGSFDDLDYYVFSLGLQYRF